MLTLQKKEVCAQLFDLEKCFKIYYVYGKRKPSSFFRFSFQATLSSTLMNALDLVYVDIDQDIYKGKTQSCSKWKTKKSIWVFFFHKHSKLWSVFLGQKVERKPLFSEECAGTTVCQHDAYNEFSLKNLNSIFLNGVNRKISVSSWAYFQSPDLFFCIKCDDWQGLDLHNLCTMS